MHFRLLLLLRSPCLLLGTCQELSAKRIVDYHCSVEDWVEETIAFRSILFRISV